MTWLKCALAYALLTSLHIPLVKRIKGKDYLSGIQYVFINTMFCMPLLVAFMLTEFAVDGIPHIEWTFWPYALLTAGIQCAGLRRAVDAFGSEEISLVTPLGALVPALVGVLAWVFLGERLTLANISGIVIIVIGAYTILADSEDVGNSVKWYRLKHPATWFVPFKTFRHRRAIRLYLNSKAIYIAFPLTLRGALDSLHPTSPYFVACITIGAMCLFSAPWKSIKKQPEFRVYEKDIRDTETEAWKTITIVEYPAPGTEKKSVSAILAAMLAGVRRGPSWTLLVPTVKHMVLVLLRKAKPNSQPVRGGKLASAFCLSACIVAAQQYTELNAYANANVAVVSAIFKLDIPLVILWGVLFFHEESPKRRLISGLIMAIGVWLLS